MAGSLTGNKNAGLSSFGVIKEVPKHFATGKDAITDIEEKIDEFEALIEDLEDRKTALEVEIEYEIANDSTLTSDVKRKAELKYRLLNNDELQKINGELKIYRRGVKKLVRERGNEERAFKWITGA